MDPLDRVPAQPEAKPHHEGDHIVFDLDVAYPTSAEQTKPMGSMVLRIYENDGDYTCSAVGHVIEHMTRADARRRRR